MCTVRWVLVLVAVAGCGGALTGRRRPAGQPATYALLINGGGAPSLNYVSHLHHLAQMHQVLRGRGVDPELITVLASDGSFPMPDVAASQPAGGDNAWLLAGTVLERALGNPIRYLNTRIESVPTRPALPRELERWFGDAGDELRAGDTLVVFVTDHGQRGATPEDTRITLWLGTSISVREFAALVDRLAPGVRVVTVMSQCYSGAFAEAALEPRAKGRRVGDTCGYFSTSADRMAYGCYPESRGGSDVGHAFSFIAGLRRTPALAEAHAQTLLTDRTPDVPIRTSDLYAERFLRRVAARRQQTVEELVSSRLTTALRPDREETGLVEQVSASFAIPVPVQAGQVAAMTRRLEELRSQLDLAATGWTVAVGELAQANLQGFLAARPRWVPQLTPVSLARMRFDRIAPFQASFLDELGAFTRATPARLERLGFGRSRRSATAAAAQRAETRSAALLRLRSLLVTLVARQLLVEAGSPDEKAGFAALRACEDFRLPSGPSSAFSNLPVALPSIESDERIATLLAPTFLGAVLSEVSASGSVRSDLPPGAMAIAAVDPASPAEAAGLQPGDILLGAPGEPVLDRGAMNLFLASPTGRAERELEILRADQRLTLRASPTATGKTIERRDLPAAARAALDGLTSFRGSVAATISARKPYLLFFWATWCPACKRSVPELLALQRAQDIPVVAITDEPSALLEMFFESWSGSFPGIIALDPGRRANEIFDINALPTYILVDENQRVRMNARGYDPGRGLPIPGWHPTTRRDGQP